MHVRSDQIMLARMTMWQSNAQSETMACFHHSAGTVLNGLGFSMLI